MDGEGHHTYAHHVSGNCSLNMTRKSETALFWLFLGQPAKIHLKLWVGSPHAMSDLGLLTSERDAPEEMECCNRNDGQTSPLLRFRLHQPSQASNVPRDCHGA
jgi:hypothetical protein